MSVTARQPDLGGLRASLARVLRTYGRERLELEYRLGHRTAGKFVPGVSEAGWERLKARLDRPSPALDRVVVTDTRELICDDGSGGKYVVDSNGGKGYWMHKKRLSDADFATDFPWSCRVSMSLEVVDPPERQQPPPAGHRFERHKRRWSYHYACWSVDLTRVISNLPHQLDNDDVSYEVEIELRDTAELFTRAADNLLEWGWSIARDMCEIMAEGA